MTKTQIWTNVQNEVNELLVANKVPKGFSEALLSMLEVNLAPKGSASANPPKLDEDGNIVEAYCRFHERYEVMANMVISNKKSKGYCRASISLWNKTNSNIKALETKSSNAVLVGDFELAQKYAIETKELKAIFNTPAFYDFDRDWVSFNKTKEPKES